MSRAFFPKIRHGHFFDVTGIFSKNVTGTKKIVTGKTLISSHLWIGTIVRNAIVGYYRDNDRNCDRDRDRNLETTKQGIEKNEENFKQFP